jgi:Flp pilus assembly protein TadD
MFLDRGFSDRAVADLNRVLELSPHEGIAYANRGLAYLHLGKRREGERDFSRALELAPGIAIFIEVRTSMIRKLRKDSSAFIFSPHCP